jgi:hypothetical protein
MSKRKGSRGGGAIIPSSQAIAALRGDAYPLHIKAALRLSLRGGRQRRRACLACGKVGVHCEVYVTDRTMSVGGDPDGKGYAIYWSCPGCHQRGLTPELEQKLLEGMR